MFRDGVEQPKFGVGSLIGVSITKYLVVSTGELSVGVIDMRNFSLIAGAEITVQDPSHLTSKEAGSLASLIQPSWSFSDFDWEPRGLKTF